MQKDIFEKALKRKVSQITFSGHRVNDDYTINKRKAIMMAVLSAFDEAAQQGRAVDAPQADLTDLICYNGNHESKDGICVVDGGQKPSSR